MKVSRRGCPKGCAMAATAVSTAGICQVKGEHIDTSKKHPVPSIQDTETSAQKNERMKRFREAHAVQRSGDCGPGEGGRDEVYRHQVQTLRRLCHLRFEGGSVQHCAGDTVQARSFEGACGGVQGTGHPAGVLLLAGPGLDSTGRHRLQNWRSQTTHVPLGPCAGRQPCAVPGNQGDSAGQGVTKQLRRVSGDSLVRYSRV